MTEATTTPLVATALESRPRRQFILVLPSAIENAFHGQVADLYLDQDISGPVLSTKGFQ